MDSFTFAAAKPIEKYHKIDVWMLISIVLLWGLGIFTLFAASQNSALKLTHDPLSYVKRQLLASAVGFVFFLFFMLLDMKYIRKLVSIIVIGALILCILTFIPALSGRLNGARRWLKIGSFTFQPSELVKFAVILFIANYFEKQDSVFEEDKTVLPCVAGLLVFVGLVLAQKDLSTSVLILGIGIMMFFVSGEKLKWIFPFLLIAIPALILSVSLETYRLERIIGFFKPDQFSQNVNYQSLNAKRAITSGGIWGNGIGRGLVRIDSIPEIQADFIFAGWTEAMGLVGVIGYFILLSFFAFRGYKTAFNCPSKFTAYGTFGCTTLFLIQSLVNCGVVVGILPTTGIPLPFFSLGGSSVIVTLAMCGFMVNASRCENIEDKKVKSDDNSIESLTIV